MNNLKITAELVSPVVYAGDKNFPLDSLLAWAELGRMWSNFEIKTGTALRRSDIPSNIRLPLDEYISDAGNVYHCSFAIYNSGAVHAEQYWTKRFSIEKSDLLNPKEGSRKIQITAGHYRSYRNSMALLAISQLILFVRGDKSKIRNLLFRVVSIGKKGAYGYGFVSEWKIEEIDHDYSLWYDVGDRYILMRNLPFVPELDKPVDCQKGFYAIRPPYWHPHWKRECYMPL